MNVKLSLGDLLTWHDVKSNSSSSFFIDLTSDLDADSVAIDLCMIFENECVFVGWLENVPNFSVDDLLFVRGKFLSINPFVMAFKLG